MAKAKGKKGPSGGAHSHTRARLNYLHNAATYFQSAAIASKQTSGQLVEEMVTSQDGQSMSVSARIVPHFLNHTTISGKKPSGADSRANLDHLPQLSRVFVSHMRGISLKTQLRLPVETKRSFCKRCDTLLSPDISCIQEIRNDSRDRKKPWADVRVIRCTTCGTEKRFPQTERRSKKLSERRRQPPQEETQTPVA